MDKLACGEKVKQSSNFGLDEFTFILPTEIFVKVMSEVPTYKVMTMEDLYGLVTIHNVERLSKDILFSLKSHAQLKEAIGTQSAKLTFFEWCDDGKITTRTKLESVSDNPTDPVVKIKITQSRSHPLEDGTPRGIRPASVTNHEPCYCKGGHANSRECDNDACNA